MLISTNLYLLKFAEEDISSDDNDFFPSFLAKPTVYEGNQSLSVYKWGLSRGMSTYDIAKILIKGCQDQHRIATVCPRSISKNVVFLVDTSKLMDQEDIKSDDLGAWECNGSKKFVYSLDDVGRLHKQSNTDEIPSNHSIYEIQRQYFINKSLPSLKKIFAVARNQKTTITKEVVFVQYIFTDGEQEVIVKPHGNSSKSISYMQEDNEKHKRYGC